MKKTNDNLTTFVGVSLIPLIIISILVIGISFKIFFQLESFKYSNDQDKVSSNILKSKNISFQLNENETYASTTSVRLGYFKCYPSVV